MPLGNIFSAVASGIGSYFAGRNNQSAAPTPVPGQGQYGPQQPGNQMAGQIGGAVAGVATDFYEQMMQERRQERSMRMQAKHQAKATKQYFDTVFPNTNEWERLGASSPAGAQITAGAATNASQERIAKIQANTAREVALINSGAPHRQAAVSEKQVRINRMQLAGNLEEIGAKVKNLGAGTKLSIAQALTEHMRTWLTGEQAEIARIDAEYRGELNRANISAQQLRDTATAIASFQGEPEKDWKPMAAKIAKEFGLPLLQVYRWFRQDVNIKGGDWMANIGGGSPRNSQNTTRGPNMSGIDGP